MSAADIGDPTVDPVRSSWVPATTGSAFPVQSLPYGVFSAPGRDRRIGVAIGDHALDLGAVAEAGLLEDACRNAPAVFRAPSLNRFLARGRSTWTAVRARVSELLATGGDAAADVRAITQDALVERSSIELHLPVEVADYVDFYSSIDHATNVGRMLRPDGEPLLANWRHVPVAYHGRAGTVVVTGAPVLRPFGQRRSPDGTVVTGPSTRLDVELEVGFIVGQPSEQGRPVPAGATAEHVFGCVLVNDWSARDIQAWEYQPLGPFLGKSFATSISGWVVPLDALAPARVPGPDQEPPPLPHLRRESSWALDLQLEMWLRPHGEHAEERLSATDFAAMYWTLDQQVAHLTSNGANLRVGDLVASGTVSGPRRHQRGSLLELSWNGSEPIVLASGATRTFLEDGDEVILRGSAAIGGGVRLGLGEVRGTVVPAPPTG